MMAARCLPSDQSSLTASIPVEDLYLGGGEFDVQNGHQAVVAPWNPAARVCQSAFMVAAGLPAVMPPSTTRSWPLHVGSFGRERNGACAPDTADCTGNDCDLVVESLYLCHQDALGGVCNTDDRGPFP